MYTSAHKKNKCTAEGIRYIVLEIRAFRMRKQLQVGAGFRVVFFGLFARESFFVSRFLFLLCARDKVKLKERSIKKWKKVFFLLLPACLLVVVHLSSVVR